MKRWRMRLAYVVLRIVKLALTCKHVLNTREVIKRQRDIFSAGYSYEVQYGTETDLKKTFFGKTAISAQFKSKHSGITPSLSPHRLGPNTLQMHTTTKYSGHHIK